MLVGALTALKHNGTIDKAQAGLRELCARWHPGRPLPEAVPHAPGVFWDCSLPPRSLVVQCSGTAGQAACV